jgi:hypothetical protein
MRPYKIHEVLKPEVEQQIDMLLKNGFITKSDSNMISPIVCVVKHGTTKAGSMKVRIACDFRYFTVSDPFPVPDQEEVMNKSARFSFISVFDAKAGYWQTSVKPEDRWLLGFTTHHGKWEWTRTPFGAKNSGSTFCRAMQEVLSPVSDISASYVDDMGVGSHCWPTHLINLRRFLSVIKSAGITLNLQRAEFAKPKVKMIGHIIGSGSKSVDPDKVAAIIAIERPTTQKQLRRFLGMKQYHSVFVDHYAEISQVLTDLTAVKYKNRPLPWSQEHDDAFCLLERKLCDVVSLSVPRYGGLFVLRCDASKCSIGGCLYQREDDDVTKVTYNGVGEKPIKFFSQKLTPCQVNWSTIEKEAYAVVASLKKFENIVFNSDIIVYSDHNPLTYAIGQVILTVQSYQDGALHYSNTTLSTFATLKESIT